MDTAILVIVGIVVLAILAVLAARYNQGRIGARRRPPEGVATRETVADAARPGEDDPGKSARSAAVGTKAPPEAGSSGAPPRR